MKLPVRSPLSGLLALLLSSPLFAANQTWTGGSNTDWTTSADWNSGSGPVPGASDVAVFNVAQSALTIPSSPTLSTAITTEEVNFSTTTAAGYNISGSSSSGTLTLTGVSGTVINAANTAGTNTLSVPLVFSGAASIAQASGGTLLLSGPISTNTSLAISGGGTINISGNIAQTAAAAISVSTSNTALTLSGSNSFAGGVTLNNTGEVVKIGNANALGTGTLTFGGGSGYAFDNVSGGPLTISNGITVSRNNGAAGLLSFTGSNNLTDTGTVTIANTPVGSTISINANTLTLNGPIVSSAAGTFTKTGAGTLVLGGASTISGGIGLNQGTLEVSASTVTTSSGITTGPVGTGTLTISASTFADNGTAITLANALSLSGAITFASTGTGSLDFGPQNLTTAKTGSFTAATTLTVNNTTTIADPISGTAESLTTAGTGTLILSGSNTYSGGTSVTAGTLLANTTGGGSATGSGTLTVSHGATLGGYGTSSGALFSISGTGTATASRANVLVGLTSATDTNTTQSLTLTGSSTSTLTNANLTFNLNSATNVGSNAGTELSVGSTAIAFGSGVQSTTLTLNLQGTSVIAANSGYILIAGTGLASSAGSDQYTGLTLGTSTGSLSTGLITPILNSGNGGSGDLTLALSSGAAGYYGGHSYLFLYQNSTTGVDDIEVEVVPEPGTWALMLGGLAMLICWQRRNRKRAA
jgi:autotransporter-associated beta strand protein